MGVLPAGVTGMNYVTFPFLLSLRSYTLSLLLRLRSGGLLPFAWQGAPSVWHWPGFAYAQGMSASAHVWVGVLLWAHPAALNAGSCAQGTPEYGRHLCARVLGVFILLVVGYSLFRSERGLIPS